MNRKQIITVAAIAVTGVMFADFEKPAEPQNVPELMTTADGKAVTTREQWEQIRRPELLRIFLEKEYGVRPVERPADLKFEQIGADAEVYDGKAIKKVVRGIYSGPGGTASFTFAAWIPKSNKPVPAFIHVSPRPAETADDIDGPRPVYYLPAEYITSRGYAALASCDYDFTPDFSMFPDTPTSGVFKVYGPKSMKERAPHEWGILSAWAWGASRLMDWIETEPSIDAKHVGVVGLSRNGKTALVAGATDERFAMTVSCCSGCGGAKLNHIQCHESETIRQIMAPAWRWFCPVFAAYIDKDKTMPFDQHQFLALIAPRLLYVSSASEDA
jgi:dienelactone hydrolase